MTRDKVNVQGDGRVFSNPNEVLRAYESETIDIHANTWIDIDTHGRSQETRWSLMLFRSTSNK